MLCDSRALPNADTLSRAWIHFSQAAAGSAHTVPGRGLQGHSKYTLASDLSIDPAGKTVATCHLHATGRLPSTHTHQLGWRLGFLPGSPPSASLLCLRTGGNRPQRNTALHGLDGRETSRHRCGPWLWTAGSPVTPTPHFTERAGTPTWKSIQCAQCQQPPHQGTAEQSQQTMGMCHHLPVSWNIAQP